MEPCQTQYISYFSAEITESGAFKNQYNPTKVHPVLTLAGLSEVVGAAPSAPLWRTLSRPGRQLEILPPQPVQTIRPSNTYQTSFVQGNRCHRDNSATVTRTNDDLRITKLQRSSLTFSAAIDEAVRFDADFPTDPLVDMLSLTYRR